MSYKRVDRGLAMVQFILECIQKIPEHAEILHRWRSDPEVLQMSFHQERMALDAFWEHFKKYFLLKDLPSLFAHLSGERVAFIGFDPFCSPASPERKSAEISIVVAPGKRGQGIGAELLLVVRHYALEQGY